MNKCVLGIDLGTSSVKIVRKYRDGHIEKSRNTYKAGLPLGWWEAILSLFQEINWDEVEAIGLSSQVGTYLVNNREVISWNSSAGKEEVKWWKEQYSKEFFVKEISMPHPDIISYPLPRLKYITEHFEDIEKICQPKEYILEKLTGEWVTDPYSWRGLVNLSTQEYSAYFLQQLGVREAQLPTIKNSDEVAGYTREIPLENNCLPAGIPVFTGLNDYYAGLLGMGINKTGQMFDVTGTSEHLGVLQEELVRETSLVSGPYIEHMVHYGVTASSGPSIKYGLKLLENSSFDREEIRKEKTPIFLPYVKGERAPVWNADARGVFFGIEENCTKEQMAYAVMEGVVFSLYHIYETMGKPDIEGIRVSGGAAKIESLNCLKADIFGVPIEIVEESDVSGLGACMVAALGMGWCENTQDITKDWVHISNRYLPGKNDQAWFEKRYAIYKEVYQKLKPVFDKWKDV